MLFGLTDAKKLTTSEVLQRLKTNKRFANVQETNIDDPYIVDRQIRYVQVQVVAK